MPKEQKAAGPSHIIAGVTPGWQDFHVVDTATGETITHVLEADATGGRVRRLSVVDGSLVIVRGDFVVIEEDRAVTIEPIVAAAPASDGNTTPEGDAE